MSSDKLAQFEKQKFINLETFRKSGLGVKTPVWFIEQNGVLFVRTIDNSGKVKRIRNNSRVRVAPCDMRGGVLGKWVEAQARLVDEATAEKVNKLLKRKYGLQKKFFDRMGGLRKEKSATLEIIIL
jgi:PPOX class probable F420-dependent enzyme